MTGSAEVRIVLSTTPPERAGSLARSLVQERLAACVNVIPAIQSVYRWEGRVQDDQEALLVIKSVSGRVEELVSRLTELHPYDVPEALVLPVDGGSARYLEWVSEACAPDGSS
jgi:periplasmic divalent cation tolerance protein